VGGHRRASGALPRTKTPVPIVQEAELAPYTVWTCLEIRKSPTGIPAPVRSARSLISILTTLIRHPLSIACYTVNKN
jgi:hypothetical protein